MTKEQNKESVELENEFLAFINNLIYFEEDLYPFDALNKIIEKTQLLFADFPVSNKEHSLELKTFLNGIMFIPILEYTEHIKYKIIEQMNKKIQISYNKFYKLYNEEYINYICIPLFTIVNNDRKEFKKWFKKAKRKVNKLKQEKK